MAKSVGKGILEVCTLLEANGPGKSRDVADKSTLLTYGAAREYCTRALDKGFLKKDGSNPPRYRVAPNWRELVTAHESGNPATNETPGVRHFSQIRNSAFDVRELV